jgi:hypothetical protein
MQWCCWDDGCWESGMECSVMIYYIHIKFLVRVSLFLRVIDNEAETQKTIKPLQGTDQQ